MGGRKLTGSLLLAALAVGAIGLLSGCPTHSFLDDVDAELNKSITVTYPNGGETIVAGTGCEIKWTCVGDLTANVQIRLLNGTTGATNLSEQTTNDGSFNWDVPADFAEGDNYRIEITVLAATAYTDESDAAFAVKKLQVLSPNGGEALAYGGSYTIKWQTVFTGTVKIDLLRSGSLVSTIAPTAPNTGTYDWSGISCTAGTGYQIRVSVVDSLAIDTSDGTFGVIDGISLTSFTSGGVITPSVDYVISWSGVKSGNVSIKLYKDGIESVSIAEATENDGTYTWSVPAGILLSGGYKIRVTTVTDPPFMDESDTAFTIEKITVVSPNGGETYIPDHNASITWTSSGTGNVRIELLVGMTDTLDITTSTPNDGSFSWPIPAGQAEGNDYKVKITWLDASGYSDQSDSVFALSKLNVTSPNGGEVLGQGGACTITWEAVFTGNVKIELFKGGVLYAQLISSAANLGSYVWTNISCSGGTDYRIKITINGSATFATSAADFAVVDSISLTSLLGADEVLAGAPVDISWTGVKAGTVAIELWKGGVKSADIVASTANDGSYSWSVPTGQTLAGDYRIHIATATTPSFTDASDTDFRIEKIVVTAPNGGEVYQPGDSVSVGWTSSGLGSVKIELYKAGAKNTDISTTTANNGSYSWSVPGGQTLAGDYTIRITTLTTPALYDASDANFTIDKIAVTSPNGAEVWDPGSVHNVTWTSSGAGSVKIELYKGGVKNADISASTSNNGVFSWTIPGGQTLGGDYTVRVTNITNTAITDTSDAAFVVEKITVTSPNGGEILKAGVSTNVTWTSSGTGSVKIELYKGGVYNSTISANAPNNGTYSWTVPSGQILYNDYRVRVTSLSSAAFWDESNANFTVEKIVVTAPNGGQTWYGFGTYTITWTSSGTGNVSISVSGPSSQTIVSSTPNDGSYSWMIDPSGFSVLKTGATYTIRVANSSVYDDSDSGFTINAWTDRGEPSATSTNWFDMAIASDNDPFVVYTDSGTSYIHVMRWSSGTTWTDYGIPGGEYGMYVSIAVASGDVPIVAFTTASGLRVYKWSSGTTWTDLGTPGTGASENEIAIGSDGKPVVAYLDDTAHKVYVKKWSSGTTWTNLGTVTTGSSQYQLGLVLDSSGNPIVASNDYVGSVYVLRVMKWSSGTTWTDLGTVATDGPLSAGVAMAIRTDNIPIVSVSLRSGTMLLTAYQWSSPTTWTSIGAPSYGYASSASLAVTSTNIPVALEIEGGACYLWKWSSGTSWTYWGSATSGSALYPSVKIASDGKPVVGYQESNYAHARKWDGN